MLDGCNGKKPRIFHDHLVIFHHIEERENELFIFDGDDVVKVLTHIRENLGSWRFDRSSVSDGVYAWQGNNLARLDGTQHAGSAFRLYSDDFDVRVQKLGKSRNACGKPTATDRDENIID